MEESRPHEVWAAGDRYEPYVGRWSRRVARMFLPELGVPPEQDWLDVGCGTGALVQTILDHASPRSVVGTDLSPGFAEYARAHLPDPRVRIEVADAQHLPLGTGSVDAAVSGLVLNFVPEPGRAASEMTRVVRAGGLVAAYVWDYAEGMEFMRLFWEAAVALNPAAPDEGRRFSLCHPGPLADLFAGAGLGQVNVRPIDLPTVFRDFDDYWLPFLGGQGAAPAYAMTLSEDDRAALRECLRAGLPTEDDGSIHLTARAWAVRGIKTETWSG
ncbi:methyltransferase domain-containing protein [Deinococcus sp. YIM 134068]|uniref:class I SAM-dependent methyltransferase n=1 Tax=Deinococcus lichenicola TaxID=3118910 RepID=UPI002F92A879